MDAELNDRVDMKQFDTPAAAPNGSLLLAATDVQGVETLLAGCDPSTFVVRVGAEADGVLEIRKALDHSNPRELHLLCHGAPGVLKLGRAWLDAEALVAALTASKATGLQMICFWACDLASGDAGALFLQRVADATGAAVHGASGLVGHHARGGSWTLSHCAGPKEPRHELSSAPAMLA